MTACAQCGDCCRVINVHGPITPLEGDAWTLYGYAPGELLQKYHWTVNQIVTAHEHDFLREHWHEIPREMAMATLPSMATREGPFYACDQFDAPTNRCLAQDTKPQVCWGYPWYESGPPVRDTTRQPVPHRTLESNRCSFWADVPWQTWPRDVLPLPSPEPLGDQPLVPQNCC